MMGIGCYQQDEALRLQRWVCYGLFHNRYKNTNYIGLKVPYSRYFYQSSGARPLIARSQLSSYSCILKLDTNTSLYQH